MNIRLVIPECKEWNGWYCSESDYIDLRIKILKKAMENNDSSPSIDLVVTSHNFFAFYPQCLVDSQSFIEENIVEKLNENLPNSIRKPLVLGFDLLTSNIKFNPYQTGIDAIVCFLDINNENGYKYSTHIWECWEEKKQCSQACFKDQNQNRIFYFNDKLFGLLSCGDIARYCHSDGQILPRVDIYLDLSHKSLKGWSSQNRIPRKILSDWRKAQLVLCTQQVKNTRQYIRTNQYPYIFTNLQIRIKVISYNLSIDKYILKGIFVDLFNL